MLMALKSKEALLLVLDRPLTCYSLDVDVQTPKSNYYNTKPIFFLTGPQERSLVQQPGKQGKQRAPQQNRGSLEQGAPPIAALGGPSEAHSEPEEPEASESGPLPASKVDGHALAKVKRDNRWACYDCGM